MAYDMEYESDTTRNISNLFSRLDKVQEKLMILQADITFIKTLLVQSRNGTGLAEERRNQ